MFGNTFIYIQNSKYELYKYFTWAHMIAPRLSSYGSDTSIITEHYDTKRVRRLSLHQLLPTYTVGDRLGLRVK